MNCSQGHRFWLLNSSENIQFEFIDTQIDYDPIQSHTPCRPSSADSSSETDLERGKKEIKKYFSPKKIVFDSQTYNSRYFYSTITDDHFDSVASSFQSLHPTTKPFNFQQVGDSGWNSSTRSEHNSDSCAVVRAHLATVMWSHCVHVRLVEPVCYGKGAGEGGSAGGPENI